MRNELLEFLCCKKCRHAPLRLAVSGVDYVEIIDGTLECPACGMVFPIREGVVDTILDESITELRTAKEYEDIRSALNDEWLLTLPYPTVHPVDTTFEHKGGDKALNFEDLLRRVDLKCGERILELGSGNCWATNVFVQKGCSCVAVDVRMRRYYGLRSARVFIESHGGYFERVLSNLDNPPFADGVFDVVFAQSSLQYAEDLEGCLLNISRILKPGGRLVLSYSGVYGIFKQIGRDEPGYHLPSLTRAISKAGFSSSMIFPVYLERHLTHGIPVEKRFHQIGRVFSFFWNSFAWLQPFIKRLTLYPMTLLFGIPVNLIAFKPVTHDSAPSEARN